ncbi:uncharacterized protein LOC125441511 [Sphaerodactylus townsendi]|uniref:uncharacterized protein LOC125441511 n=1 Tax=Sphaerodactylus townsendi TaxID=933632 RepID=UPI00202639BB|nr:uncharacterized protein LOC125441511 [Sphaerodactylus townsendi]
MAVFALVFVFNRLTESPAPHFPYDRDPVRKTFASQVFQSRKELPSNLPDSEVTPFCSGILDGNHGQKVLLSLSPYALTLALCHTYCFTRPAKLEFINVGHGGKDRWQRKKYVLRKPQNMFNKLRNVVGGWADSPPKMASASGRESKVEGKKGTDRLADQCSSGSRWNSANCLECSCRGGEMSCCSRYGGTASSPGCKAVVNPETCEYEFYRIDDPSEPCF